MSGQPIFHVPKVTGFEPYKPYGKAQRILDQVQDALALQVAERRQVITAFTGLDFEGGAE